MSSTTAPKYQGQLILWAASGVAGYPGAKPDRTWFEERAKAYETAHPGIRVDVMVDPSPKALEQREIERWTGNGIGNGGDGGGNVMNVTAPPDLIFGRFLAPLADHLADVTPLLKPADRADYLPNALQAFSRNGQQLGLPVLLEVQGLALNQQAFAAAAVALPAKGQWNREQFDQSLRNLSGTERFGLGFYQLPEYHEYWPLLSDLIRPDGTLAPDSVDGMSRLQEYRRNGWLYPDTGKLTAEETWAQFAHDPAAFAVMPVSSWAVPLLRSAPYNVKLSIAAFPGGDTTGYTYGFSFLKQDDPSRLAAAVDLAQFMAAPDAVSQVSRQTGLMPARKSVGNPFVGDEPMTQLYQLSAGQQPLPAGPAWDAIETGMTRQLLYTVLDSQEPQVTAEALTRLLQSAIAPAK